MARPSRQTTDTLIRNNSRGRIRQTIRAGQNRACQPQSAPTPQQSKERIAAVGSEGPWQETSSAANRETPLWEDEFRFFRVVRRGQLRSLPTCRLRARITSELPVIQDAQAFSKSATRTHLHPMVQSTRDPTRTTAKVASSVWCPLEKSSIVLKTKLTRSPAS
jgi:hypothetical protein